MKYSDILTRVDTVKALNYLKLETNQEGAYAYYPCPKCQGKAVAKVYGEKKNLTYCTSCKDSGHVISLAMEVSKLNYETAAEALSHLAPTNKRIDKELTLDYVLQYHKVLEELGVNEEQAKRHEVGVPQGKTMCAGCLTFLVRDETGMKIAYYGIRLKDKKHVFYKDFNPELYLFNLNDAEPVDPVYFTDDMTECLKLMIGDNQAVCNFGLPYISEFQFSLLNKMEYVIFKVKNKKPIALQAMEQAKFYFRFE
jgi:hypothetical protein